MTNFERKYTAAQFEAIYDAHFARGLNYPRITRLAATGELAGEPFEIAVSYVGRKCREEKRKRLGKNNTDLAEKPHRDAIEVLRRRMISAADALSKHFHEMATKHPEKADPERGRQIARLLREAAALPAQKAEPLAKPGSKAEGTRTEGQTRDGLGGALLNAHLGANTSNRAADQPSREDEPSPAAEDVAAGSGSLTRSAATPLAA